MRDHTCDRSGRPAKIVDESGDEPITCFYPTCSVCGVPQVFSPPSGATSKPANMAGAVAALALEFVHVAHEPHERAHGLLRAASRASTRAR